MSEILREVLSSLHPWPWIAGLLLIWLCYRLSSNHPAPIARRAKRLLAQALFPTFDIAAVMDQLQQLLSEDLWTGKAMNTWRKKSIDAALDELVDAARAEGLSTSDAMAEFALARREFHDAAIEGGASTSLWTSAENIHRAAQHLAEQLRGSVAESDAALEGALTA